eukprot:scaffold908_cov333-Prasinococcus_capsulatus_cf.AAC.9
MCVDVRGHASASWVVVHCALYGQRRILRRDSLLYLGYVAHPLNDALHVNRQFAVADAALLICLAGKIAYQTLGLDNTLESLPGRQDSRYSQSCGHSRRHNPCAAHGVWCVRVLSTVPQALHPCSARGVPPRSP